MAINHQHSEVYALEWLLEIINSDDELRSGQFLGFNGKARALQKWDNISRELNALAEEHGGAQKNGPQWKEALNQLKNRAKKAYNIKMGYVKGTGGGKSAEAAGLGLSEVYQKCMDMFGTVTACGNRSVASALQIQRELNQSVDHIDARSPSRYQRKRENFVHKGWSNQRSSKENFESHYDRGNGVRNHDRISDDYHKMTNQSCREDYGNGKTRTPEHGGFDDRSRRPRTPVPTGYTPSPKRPHFGASNTGMQFNSQRADFSPFRGRLVGSSPTRFSSSPLHPQIDFRRRDGSRNNDVQILSPTNSNETYSGKTAKSFRSNTHARVGNSSRRLPYSAESAKSIEDLSCSNLDDGVGLLPQENADRADQRLQGGNTGVSDAVETLNSTVLSLKECVDKLAAALTLNSEALAKNCEALETLAKLS